MFRLKDVVSKRGMYILASIVILITSICFFNSHSLSSKKKANNYSRTVTQNIPPGIRTRISYLIKINRNVAQQSLDSSIKLMEEVFRKSLEYNFYEGLFASTYYTGISYIDKGEYKRARLFLTKALSYAPSTEAPNRDYCRAMNNIGNSYQYEGNYRKAIQYYFLAVSHAETDYRQMSLLVRIYNNIGSSFLQLNENKSAIYYLDRAEYIAKMTRLLNHLPSVYNNKAKAYFKSGDKNASWAYSYKSWMLSQHYIGMSGAQFTALLNMAKILIEQKKPMASIPYLEAALKVKGSINPYLKVDAMYSLGCAYMSAGDRDKANQYFAMALRQTNERNISEFMPPLYQKMAQLNAAEKNFQLAYNNLQVAFQLNDSLLNKENLEAINNLEVHYRTTQKDNDISHKQLFIKEQERALQQKNMWLIGIASGALILAMAFIAVYRNYNHKLKLQAKEQEISQLTAMMEGEEKERTRVSQELHDGVGSVLAAVKMNFTAVQNSYPFLSNDIQFENTMNLLDNMYHELRQASHNLSPEILIRYGLADAINIYCEQLKKNKAMSISFQAYGTFNDIDATLSLIMYRTVQELVHNIMKHARASDILVQLYHHDHLLSLMVEDNGIGFDIEELTTGIGLQNIRSRIKNMNGRLTIDSQKGAGTTVYLEFDLATKNLPV